MQKPQQRIALVYFVIVSLWILVSDTILFSLGIDETLIPSLNMFKGIAFVIVTTGILYLHLHREFNQRFQLESQLEEQIQYVKQSRDAVAQSEVRFRKAIEEAPLPVFIFAEDGEILSFSQTVLDITGYTADQLQTLDSWTELAYGERKQIVREGIDSLFDRNQRVDEGELRINCADGNQCVWDFSSTPLGQLPDGRRIIISMAFDVTERNKSQKALQRLANVFQHTGSGIAIGYPDSKNLEIINPAFAQMHGYSVEELTGQPIASVFAQQDMPKLLEAIRLSYEDGHYVYEGYHIHKDGHTFPTLIDITAVKNGAGQVQYRIVNVVNISELKRLQDEVNQKNQFLELLIQASPLGIAVFNPQGIVQLWNPAMEEVMGWSQDETLGNPLPYVREQDRTGFNQLRQRVASGETIRGLDVQRQRKDHSIVELTISAGPLYDAQGTVMGAIGIVKDTTERKHMENALQESDLRFRQIAENIREVFFLNDAEKRQTLYISPAYESIWGRSCESLYQNSRSFLDAIHPDDREQVRSSFDRQHQGEDVEVIYRVIRPDQSIRWVRARTFPVFDENHVIERIAGIAEDITDRIQYQNRLKRISQRLVTVLDDERARIARELHDQIGQELTAVGINLGIIEMHTQSIPATTPIIHDSSELISTIIERIRIIIADLRPLALNEMGLLSALRWYSERFTKRTGIPIKLESALDTAKLTPVVNNTLYQITTEALTNVAKHASAKHIWISAETDDRQLKLIIRDDGVGFDVKDVLNNEYKSNWGIQIMQERISTLVSSHLYIESTEDGTEVIVEVQL